MIKLKQQYLRALSRRFWGMTFTLIIAVAVCVQLGRQAFPLLNDYRADISRYLGDQLGVVIEIGAIDATWSGFRPKISLSNVAVLSRESEAILNIDKATAELSLLNSLFEWRLAWRQMRFDGFTTRVTQGEDGRWLISGMPESQDSSADQEGFPIDDPYDVFLFGRRIHISDARFTVQYANGDEASLLIPQISLDNDEDFHRIRASIDLSDGRRMFSLVIEGRGDPRDDNFAAQGYLELNDFPTQRLADALALSAFDIDSSRHVVNAQLWFTGDADKGVAVKGYIDAAGELSLGDQGFDLPQRISATLTGRMRPERGWYLTMQDLKAEWQDTVSPSTDVRIYGDFRRINGLRFKALDLESWATLLTRIGTGHDRADEIIAQLQPRGLLKNLDISFTDKTSGYFRATAAVEDVALEAFKGAPSVDNASGFLSLSSKDGSFDLRVDDELKLGLPKVYHDPLVFTEAYGQIGWQVDFENKMTYVTSSLLSVVNSDERGFGYLSLSLPFKKQYGEQQMTLLIGVPEAPALSHKKYVPKTIPKTLYSWLDRSIQGGTLRNAKFLFHGSVEKGPQIQPSVQLYGELSGGRLLSDPQWPVLEDVGGRIVIDNRRLDIRLNQGDMLGNRLTSVRANVVKNPYGPGQSLAINARASGDAESAQALVNRSPLQQQIGEVIRAWELDGALDARLKLLFPLNADNPGLYQKVDIGMRNARMGLPDIDLDIRRIRGRFTYETGRGLYARKLSARLFDQEFTTSIASEMGESGSFDTRISFVGAAGIEALKAWTKRPELNFMTGLADVSGELLVPAADADAPMQLMVSSTLEGIAVDLPAPLGKSADEAVSFSTRVRRYDAGDEYQIQLDNRLRLSLLNSERGSTSAFIEINNLSQLDDDMRPISDTGRFEVAGHIRRFDLDRWAEVRDRYFAYATTDEPLPDVNLNLFIENLVFGDLEIENLRLDGERQPAHWLLRVSSEMLAGEFRVPDEDGAPVELNLDYLRLAAMGGEGENDSETNAGMLAEFDLTRAVNVNFATRELSLGADNFGQWRFKLRPIDNGIVIHDIHAEVRGMNVGTEDNGAEFIWLQTEEGQSSQFTGVLTAGNLSDVFKAWGQEEVLKSERAQFSIDARWPGAPDEVALKAVEGLITLDIRDGSFNRGAGSDENGLLRLVALFNFDTILRRLRLDFSDLAARGYAFDRIEGDLDFRDGTIFLTEPLKVEASSSRLQLAGTVDVINEELDGEMVATLPVGGNATLATALVAGLPAAVGVYLLSKIFKKQIDQVSSLNIGVQGEWEDPKIRVKRVFDIDAANRRGQQLRDEQNAVSPSPETVLPEVSVPEMSAPETAELN